MFVVVYILVVVGCVRFLLVFVTVLLFFDFEVCYYHMCICVVCFFFSPFGTRPCLMLLCCVCMSLLANLKLYVACVLLLSLLFVFCFCFF